MVVNILASFAGGDNFVILLIFFFLNIGECHDGNIGSHYHVILIIGAILLYTWKVLSALLSTLFLRQGVCIHSIKLKNCSLVCLFIF